MNNRTYGLTMRRALSSLLLAAALALPQASLTGAQAAAVTARKAADFVQSVGVGGQFAEGKGPYANNMPALKDAMRELGVLYYRTSAVGPRAAAVAEDLYRSLGMRGVFHVSKWDGKKSNGPLAGSAGGVIDALAANGTAGIFAIEGPNELNQGGPSNWPQLLRDYQKEIYTHVRSNPRFQGILVAAPTLVTNADNPKPSVALGVISDRIDVGAMHDYVNDGGATESRFRPAAAMLRANNFGAGPILVTETGVCTEWQMVKEYSPSQKCVSQKAQAKYLPRNLLDKFDEYPGNKAFIFELLERQPAAEGARAAAAESSGGGRGAGSSSGGDGWWGWGIIDANMNRKPAFYAVRNLISLLNDGGADFTPGSLDYSLKGAGGVRQVLVQKQDGRFYLMLWQPVRSFDKDSNTDIDPSPADVALHLGQQANIKIYKPTPLNGTTPDAALQPIETHSGVTSVDLKVPDHVLVVEIAPAGR